MNRKRKNSLEKIEYVVYSNWIDIQNGASRVRFPHSTQTFGFKNILSQHLVRQLWQPDGCRRKEGRLSTTLAAKECMLSTHQERSFRWIDPSEWWWEKKHGESLVATIGTWRYPIRTYKSLGAMSMMYPVCKAPRSHSSLFQKFSCTLYYSQA